MANPKNVFLIGPMGAGKSAVGRHLARLMHLDFVDSDEEIENRTGVDISFIFEKEGEEGFRKREVKMIDELSQMQGIVLADSRSRLGARGFVVYLHTTVQQQLDRTQRGRKRPLLEDGDQKSVLEALMEVRDPLYREIADLTTETDGRRVQAVARDLADAIK